MLELLLALTPGRVLPDGPVPGILHYCMTPLALNRIPDRGTALEAGFATINDQQYTQEERDSDEQD